LRTGTAESGASRFLLWWFGWAKRCESGSDGDEWGWWRVAKWLCERKARMMTWQRRTVADDELIVSWAMSTK
jgi:hypothetical protein